MKNILLITSFVAALFAFGCKPSAKDSAADQMDKAQAETKDAAQQMRDYTFAQKAEFVTTMREKLTELNRNLDELSDKIDKSSDAVQAEAKPKLAALRDQASKLNKQLDVVTDATESTWDSVKTGFEKAYGDLKDGFAQSRQWVSDKIAP